MQTLIYSYKLLSLQGANTDTRWSLSQGHRGRQHHGYEWWKHRVREVWEPSGPAAGRCHKVTGVDSTMVISGGNIVFVKCGSHQVPLLVAVTRSQGSTAPERERWVHHTHEMREPRTHEMREPRTHEMREQRTREKRDPHILALRLEPSTPEGQGADR